MDQKILIAVVAVAAVAVFGAVVTMQPAPGGKAANAIPSGGAQGENAPDSPVRITAAALAEHDTAGDCWIAYKGKVYDVTGWASSHGGGAAGITQHCGSPTSFEQGASSTHGSGKDSQFFAAVTPVGDYAG